jgi:hypothetical protein
MESVGFATVTGPGRGSHLRRSCRDVLRFAWRACGAAVVILAWLAALVWPAATGADAAQRPAGVAPRAVSSDLPPVGFVGVPSDYFLVTITSDSNIEANWDCVGCHQENVSVHQFTVEWRAVLMIEAAYLPSRKEVRLLDQSRFFKSRVGAYVRDGVEFSGDQPDCELEYSTGTAISNGKEYFMSSPVSLHVVHGHLTINAGPVFDPYFSNSLCGNYGGIAINGQLGDGLPGPWQFSGLKAPTGRQLVTDNYVFDLALNKSVEVPKGDHEDVGSDDIYVTFQRFPEIAKAGTPGVRQFDRQLAMYNRAYPVRSNAFKALAGG